MPDQEGSIKNDDGRQEDGPTHIVRVKDPVDVDELAWLIAFALCPLPVNAEYVLIEKNVQIQFDYADRIEHDFRRGALCVRDSITGLPVHETHDSDELHGHVFLDDVNAWLTGLRVPVRFLADPDGERSFAQKDESECIERQLPRRPDGVQRADDFRLTLEWAWHEFVKENDGEIPTPKKLWAWMMARPSPLPNGVLSNKGKNAFVFNRDGGHRPTVDFTRFVERLRNLPAHVNSRKKPCE